MGGAVKRGGSEMRKIRRCKKNDEKLMTRIFGIGGGKGNKKISAGSHGL